MMRRLDPRAWNLYASVAVVAACGPSQIGSSGSGQATEPGETETADPECVDDDDCPTSYACHDGVCKYAGYDDGWYDPYGDGDPGCNSDASCPTYSHCLLDCDPIDPPSPECGIPLPASIALEVIDGPALALQFVDVDADGQDELAIVTASSIALFDDVVDPPTVSPRGVESAAVDALVAGEFDPVSGEDLLLLWSGALWRHDSNGATGFGPATSIASSLDGPVGALAGNFAEGPSTELLIWSATGAVIERFGDTPLIFTSDPVMAATALDLDAPVGSVMLGSNGARKLYDLGGVQTGEHGGDSAGPYASFTTVSIGYHVTIAGDAPDWRALVIHDATAGTELHRWALRFAPDGIAAGDLDGDGNQDLVFWSHEEEVGIEMDPLGPNRCWRTVSTAVGSSAAEVAVGDFDGDGDDEIATRLAGQVRLWQTD